MDIMHIKKLKDEENKIISEYILNYNKNSNLIYNEYNNKISNINSIKSNNNFNYSRTNKTNDIDVENFEISVNRTCKKNRSFNKSKSILVLNNNADINTAINKINSNNTLKDKDIDDLNDSDLENLFKSSKKKPIEHKNIKDIYKLFEKNNNYNYRTSKISLKSDNKYDNECNEHKDNNFKSIQSNIHNNLTNINKNIQNINEYYINNYYKYSSTKEADYLEWVKEFKWDNKVINILQMVFGHNNFRQNQREIINSCLSGRDVFVCMPTGGGKSITYQIPALAEPGVSIVIMPLISLMQDQLDIVRSLGIKAFSTKENLNFNEVYNNIKMGILEENNNYIEEDQIFKNPNYKKNNFKNKFSHNKYYKLIFTTPEKLQTQSMIKFVYNLYNNSLINRFVIDEAHCVSKWGNEFRTDYIKLSYLRKEFPRVSILALTATASLNVRSDVMTTLGFNKDSLFFQQSYNRTNLKIITYSKEEFKKYVSKYDNKLSKKTSGYINHIADYIKSKNGASGIVYCLTQKNAQNVAETLNNCGINCVEYHANLKPKEKEERQNSWKADDIQVIVATCAFGMGINKNDVRFVVHNGFPSSYENYYQEIGRAGRDSELAECILYYGYDNKNLHEFLTLQIDNTFQRVKNMRRINQMINFCEDKFGCRRTSILQYFDESFNRSNCNNLCDNCIKYNNFFENLQYYLIEFYKLNQNNIQYILNNEGNYVDKKKYNSNFISNLSNISKIRYYYDINYSDKAKKIINALDMLEENQKTATLVQLANILKDNDLKSNKGLNYFFNENSKLKSEYVGCFSDVPIEDLRTLIRKLIIDEVLLEKIISNNNRSPKPLCYIYTNKKSHIYNSIVMLKNSYQLILRKIINYDSIEELLNKYNFSNLYYNDDTNHDNHIHFKIKKLLDIEILYKNNTDNNNVLNNKYSKNSKFIEDNHIDSKYKDFIIKRRDNLRYSSNKKSEKYIISEEYGILSKENFENLINVLKDIRKQIQKDKNKNKEVSDKVNLIKIFPTNGLKELARKLPTTETDLTTDYIFGVNEELLKQNGPYFLKGINKYLLDNNLNKTITTEEITYKLQNINRETIIKNNNEIINRLSTIKKNTEEYKSNKKLITDIDFDINKIISIDNYISNFKYNKKSNQLYTSNQKEFNTNVILHTKKSSKTDKRNSFDDNSFCLLSTKNNNFKINDNLKIIEKNNNTINLDIKSKNSSSIYLINDINFQDFEKLEDCDYYDEDRNKNNINYEESDNIIKDLLNNKISLNSNNVINNNKTKYDKRSDYFKKKHIYNKMNKYKSQRK